MKNLLNMSDSEDEGKGRKDKKKGKKQESDSEDDDEASDEEEEKKGDSKKKKNDEDIFGNKKTHGEDLRAIREAERKRREEEEKQKADRLKQMSMFLGESHGHFKMGVFVRIELQIQKKFSRQLIPEYPVVLCSLRQ